MIRSSILVREPCGRRGKKRRTRRQHLAGKRQALFSPSGGGEAATAGRARARRLQSEARARFFVTRQIARFRGEPGP